MKKQKIKPKGTPKEVNAGTGRGQVVKLRPAKPKTSWRAKLPSPGQWLGTARQFVVEAWQELKKVTFPTRRETLGTTGVVLFLVAVISIFLGLVDFGLSRLVSYVMH
ncbi:MAG: preprotein translocase subunit SecE [Deltaproteobacteria bacterium]|nr:preprotein translocase subunit SecE [Deltaproteobacteria bacterium]